jgi:tartrate dehydratase alpha subunit/fumarate hydratase class I-like protein
MFKIIHGNGSADRDDMLICQDTGLPGLVKVGWEFPVDGRVAAAPERSQAGHG